MILDHAVDFAYSAVKESAQWYRLYEWFALCKFSFALEITIGNLSYIYITYLTRILTISS